MSPKNITKAIGFLFCLISGSATAAHQTHLRGIVNLPGLQCALLEIHYPIGTNTHTIKRSWRVYPKQTFEDNTIKGAHFQFEVLDVDFAKQTLKTREDGEEHTYTLPAPDRGATANSWLHLQNAPFNDFIDIYSEIAGRALLLHPALRPIPVSMEVTWSENTPEKEKIAHAFVNYLNKQEISVVNDGVKFLQILPDSQKTAACPKSDLLPPGPPQEGCSYFEKIDSNILVDIYSRASGRRRNGNQLLPGIAFYFRTGTTLTKPEYLYVFETLLAWNNIKITLASDNTFSANLVSPGTR